jgi:hypothetical protein
VVSSTRALLLALAMESSSGSDRRYLRFRKHKTAFFATLVLRPDEYAMLGLVEHPGGVDVLWDWQGVPRLRPAG